MGKREGNGVSKSGNGNSEKQGADWGRWMIAGNRLESIARMDGTEADGSISWCGHVALGIVFSICHCPCHLPNFSIH
ncbi:hypothetical protein ES332_D06G032900v1 [Gossypium tomentosum]|uniref:Uncharacterized protein n=1 Tax=Gossypium tomentosum TaxID=34277 RepID=A0A5D2KDP3_GOSTO|nr:hypothetical protein ES332_D06G032900v1 [Gossypium tomentosum]